MGFTLQQWLHLETYYRWDGLFLHPETTLHIQVWLIHFDSTGNLWMYLLDIMFSIVLQYVWFCFVVRACSNATPEKVEVFVDDKPVYVPPGSTVLQVYF